MHIDRILRNYRDGDEDTRMILFLAYRDLRDEFITIEQDAPSFTEKRLNPANPGKR